MSLLCEHCGKDQNPSGNNFNLCQCYHSGKPKKKPVDTKPNQDLHDEIESLEDEITDLEKELKISQQLYQDTMKENQDAMSLKMDLETMFDCFVGATTSLEGTEPYNKAMDLAKSIMDSYSCEEKE